MALPNKKSQQNLLKIGLLIVNQLFSSISAKRILVLNDLYVDEPFRKSGAAKSLMEKALEYAQRQKAYALSLSTAHDNYNAKALYESLGYKQDKHYLHYVLSIEMR
jgi:ribosomal protein S18 acetylase RimI-like enzyme